MLALTSVWMPAYQVRLMEMASPEQRGLVAGMGSMAMSLGFATMSFNGGRIAATSGYSQLFLLGAGLALACAALVTISVRVMRRPVEESLTEIPMSGEVATAAPRT
jgi:predicted MFS family arabinose efflux permease